jgi:hypothetical protein
MSEKLKLIAEGWDVSRLLWAIRSHPELWDEHTARTASPDSPHHGLSDIWLRFGAPETAMVDGQHELQWYPSANVLGIRQMCHDLMHMVGGVELGGVLLTRIPPGASCKPHTDASWHTKRYDKFVVQIASAPGQAFHFDGECLEAKPGDVYWFDNQYMHWVVNNTPYERVSLIVCIRGEN